MVIHSCSRKMTWKEHCHSHSIKVSYFCSRNMNSIVTATTSRSASLPPETWPALSQPQHQGQLVLLQKHDLHFCSHNIKVSYSCSRNMKSIVTASTSRSATLAPETWPALSQSQHQGQLLLLQNMTSIVTASTSRSATLVPETWPALSQPQHQGQLLLLQNMTSIVTATTSRSATLAPETWHCHNHKIKVSYSCSRNMTSIVTSTTSRSATLAPETWPALSQPQYQGQLLLLQKHEQHCHSHNIKVSYSCSRNMTSIVTASTSRSASLAPETWPALSQPQHQGQLLLLQKHEQHCHSHNIKVSYSCSRNMTCIVAATTSRSATLAPETWPALSQPQHQGQQLLLQKHDLHCRSHNTKVSYSCSRNMTSIVTATTSRSATLAPETWPALSSQPQHQGQILLLQKHYLHCRSLNTKVSYSCSRNMNSIVTATTSRSANLAPETWPALSQPQHQGQLVLLQKHDLLVTTHNKKY